MGGHDDGTDGIVERAVVDALEHAREAYDARGVLVVRTLDATARVAAPPQALYQAVYTLFRGLPARVPPGSVLYVSTQDAEGGGVALSWEVREEGRPAPGGADSPKALLTVGPFGDLYDLALLGLERICGASGALREEEEARAPNSSSLLARDSGRNVRRRYTFVVPGA